MIRFLASFVLFAILQPSEGLQCHRCRGATVVGAENVAQEFLNCANVNGHATPCPRADATHCVIHYGVSRNLTIVINRGCGTLRQQQDQQQQQQQQNSAVSCRQRGSALLCQCNDRDGCNSQQVPLQTHVAVTQQKQQQQNNNIQTRNGGDVGGNNKQAAIQQILGLLTGAFRQITGNNGPQARFQPIQPQQQQQQFQQQQRPQQQQQQFQQRGEPPRFGNGFNQGPQNFASPGMNFGPNGADRRFQSRFSRQAPSADVDADEVLLPSAPGRPLELHFSGGQHAQNEFSGRERYAQRYKAGSRVDERAFAPSAANTTTAPAVVVPLLENRERVVMLTTTSSPVKIAVVTMTSRNAATSVKCAYGGFWSVFVVLIFTYVVKNS